MHLLDLQTLSITAKSTEDINKLKQFSLKSSLPFSLITVFKEHFIYLSLFNISSSKMQWPYFYTSMTILFDSVKHMT